MWGGHMLCFEHNCLLVHWRPFLNFFFILLLWLSNREGDRRAETVNFRIRNSFIVFHVRWERETDPSILPRSDFSSIFSRFVFAMKWSIQLQIVCRYISDKLSAVCMMVFALVLRVKAKYEAPIIVKLLHCQSLNRISENCSRREKKCCAADFSLLNLPKGKKSRP